MTSFVPASDGDASPDCEAEGDEEDACSEAVAVGEAEPPAALPPLLLPHAPSAMANRSMLHKLNDLFVRKIITPAFLSIMIIVITINDAKRPVNPFIASCTGQSVGRV
ncbi:hypothetical protein [Cohnella sp. 56]|uniref:hypothetical protein n=1 Tax=Cohnella sp. 56 TaxID=3113722 RepID=UPI0030E829E8